MKQHFRIVAYSQLFIFALAGVAHAASPAPVSLGLASRFAVLAGAGVSNEPTSLIVGDVGVSPAGKASFTGFNLSGSKEVNGFMIAADDATPSALATLRQAKSDFAAALSDTAQRPATAAISGNIGGKTFEPGVYRSTGSVELAGGDATLDGKGDRNAAWIFQIAGNFTVAPNRSIVLTGDARAQNVFWQVNDSATFNSGIIFNGNILANQSITLGAATKLNGRAFALNGSVALKYNDIQIPDEPPSFAPAPATAPAAVAPAPVTQTAAEDAQLAMLLATLADLQKQVVAQSAPATAPATAPAAPAPATPAKPAAQTPVVNETKALQIFLNTHGFQIAASGPGSPGNETTKFGALTKKALCAFQVSEGIVDAPSHRSCGVHGPKTRARIKAMSQ